MPELKNTLKAEIAVGCNAPEVLVAEVVAYFDNNLIVSEKLLDSEIIASVIQKDSETDSDTQGCYFVNFFVKSPRWLMKWTDWTKLKSTHFAFV